MKNNTWTKQNLGDVCIQITDGKHGDCRDQFSSGYYFISSKDVFDGHVHYDNARQITEEDFVDTNRRTKLEIGDILITNSGTIGRMALIKQDDKVKKTTFQKSVAIVKPNIAKVDSNFLYFCLLSNFKQLVNLGGGAAQHNLLLGDLRRFTVTLPDTVSLQGQIASVLSSYDNLIENNEKRINILEEMAQRLYTEWFVKFEFPEHKKVGMVDSGSEYGLIPERWRVVPMELLAEFVNGYPFKPSDLGNNGLPVVKIPELRSGILEKTPRNDGNNMPKKYLIRNGDILFSWSATLLVNIWNSGDALLNQHLFKVSPKLDTYNSYVYYLLTALVKKLSKQVVGATMQHLRRGTIVNAKVILPTIDILEKYENEASTLIMLIGKLQMQNQNLQKTRDLLIPQLVTGKRIVKN
jgi:type I restriction enzyme S subunit